MVAGLRVTLDLCLIIWTSGIVLGTLLGIAGAKWKPVAVPLKVFSIILAAVPALVLLFWMHYPLQTLLGVVIDPFITAATALSIINISLVSDLVREVLRDFPQQYVWAAQVSGLTEKETVLHVKLPIVLRQTIPSLLNIQIVMLQSTLFASLISVDEIFRTAQRINSLVYRPIPIYSLLALFFILVCVPLHGLAYYLRVRFTRDLSER
jgi:His/Glu/Gln/Arg/opine family amino acid ABC transporter permease subunit